MIAYLKYNSKFIHAVVFIKFLKKYNLEFNFKNKLKNVEFMIKLPVPFFLLFFSIFQLIMSSRLSIVIGNKRYSSWSLRGWLAVRVAVGKQEFDEIFCPLSGALASIEESDRTRQLILQYSPNGKVPALIDNDLKITVYL